MPDKNTKLVTIPNVTLVETGTWQASTGEVTFTSNDLYAAANAPISDPAVKLPRMRFGHTAAGTSIYESAGGFDEQPCVGKFTNLRVENEGTALVADLVGVPAWLADVLPVAYPSRSVEAFFEVTTQTGKKHGMIIASVALLGENLPGVATLDDLELLFSEEGSSEWIDALTAQTKVAASRGGDHLPAPRRVAASVDMGDVRSSFYEQIATEESGRYWWWLHQVYIDPTVVIAEDDGGEFWLIPYDGKTAEMGEPVQVFIQWVNKDTGKVAASVSIPEQFGRPEAVYASARMSRSAARQQEFDINQQKEAKGTVPIDYALLAKRLGLPEDATEEQINEALAAAESTPEEPAPEGDPPEEDDAAEEPETPEPEAEVEPEAAEPIAASGTVVDKEAWENTRKYVEAQQKKERTAVVLAAIKDRKIPPARKAHYLSMMEKDSEGTKQFLDSLEKNAVPGPELGSSEDPESAESTQAQAGTGLFPELARQEA